MIVEEKYSKQKANIQKEGKKTGDNAKIKG